MGIAVALPKLAPDVAVFDGYPDGAFVLPPEPPEDPDTGRPVRARFEGVLWEAHFGDTDIVRERFQIVPFNSAEDAWSDIEESHFGGESAAGYVCMWNHLRRGLPARKKGWRQLSDRTRAGYIGPMRSVFGLRSEAEFERFYREADTDEMAILRRHRRPGTVIIRGHAYRRSEPRRGRQGEWPPPWCLTWKVHER